MVPDEVRVRDTIAIGEYQIFAPACDDRLVQYLAFLKTIVLLPDMLDRDIDLFFHRFNNIPGFLAGAVIGYDDFKIPVGLRRKSPQRLFQPTRMVIGRENYGSKHQPGSGWILFGLTQCI